MAHLHICSSRAWTFYPPFPRRPRIGANVSSGVCSAMRSVSRFPEAPSIRRGTIRFFRHRSSCFALGSLVHGGAGYSHGRRGSNRRLPFRFEKCAITLIFHPPPCAAMAINGVEISSSDPGAVPGASTQARRQRRDPRRGSDGFRRGRNRFDGECKGRSFARHGSAVIGPNL
jgi:hypothetical protein